MKRSGHWLTAGGVALALSSGLSDAGAEGACGESGGLTVGLTAGLGVVAGAAGALISSGVIASVDDTRDYSFGLGAGAGMGVTAGLSAIYFIFDLATGCGMANDVDGVAWSVPVTTILVGAALPAAIWGGSDEFDVTGSDEAALTGLTHRSPGPLSPTITTLTWRF
ncbi:MAG: hypothetical protein DRI90_20100 [Deltaproteobacteria bacterium]|nr:MAG: hypothetical protein DRI90_20100 [Deltaproteobacteria bacterium]